MYFKPGDHVLMIGDVTWPDEKSLIVDRVREEIIPHLGGGIYDGIVFENAPPVKILRAAIQKIYWGGFIVIKNVVPTDVEEYKVLKGDPAMLVIQRPVPPPDWTREHYLEFQPRGRVWDAIKKVAHPSYAEKFANIDVGWEGKRAVEIGCGRGEVTRLIAKAGVRRIYAVDRSPAAVALAREFCDDCENVTVVCQDARLWNAPEAVSVIVALEFIEHVREEDIPAMLRVWRRYLKVGGMVHLLVPLGPDHVRDHKWAPSPTKLKQIMEAAGFKEKRHVRPEGSRKFYAEFIKR